MQVPLGVLFKSEQKHEDMLSIMESTQRQYAPSTVVQRVMHAVTEEGEEDVTVEEVQFHPLFFGVSITMGISAPTPLPSFSGSCVAWVPGNEATDQIYMYTVHTHYYTQ